MSKTRKRFIVVLMAIALLIPMLSAGMSVASESVAEEASYPVWRQVDPRDIVIGKSYVIVSEHGALTNASVVIPTPTDILASVAGKAVTPVTVEGEWITSEVTPDMVWQFDRGGNTAAANAGVGVGNGFYLRNAAPGDGAGLSPLRREPSNNAANAPINTINAAVNVNNQSLLLHTLDAEARTAALYYWGGNNAWNFVLTSTPAGFVALSPRAASTTGAMMLEAILNAPPLRFYEIYTPYPQHFIMATSGANGRISPSSPTGHVWVNEGEDITFTFTPSIGFQVNAVRVNGEYIENPGDTYTFTNVTDSENSIHVTFVADENAPIFPFIVFNDYFATGELTTAVIIDLGEDNSVYLADLDAGMFTVTTRNTNWNGTNPVDGSRIVARVYANTEPELLGYITPAPGSPDLVTDTPASGRFIIIEFLFWGPGGGDALGGSTRNGAISLRLNYNITLNRELVLADGSTLGARFVQDGIVSPVTDLFEERATPISHMLYINPRWETEGPLPLFLYFHGMNEAADRPAAVRIASGGSMLARMQLENPGKYESHIINTQGTPNVANLVAYIRDLAAQGKVDLDRIYISGFSLGTGTVNNLVNNHPELIAAAVPVAGGTMPSQAVINANNNVRYVAYWPFMHHQDAGAPGGITTTNNLRAYFTTGLGAQRALRNANLSLLEVNNIEPFPHFGFTITAHGSVPTVFGNTIGMMHNVLTFSTVCNVHAAYADKNIFDWIFNQRKGTLPECTLTVTDRLDLCLEEGWIEYTCVFCDAVKAVPQEPLGHDLVAGACQRCDYRTEARIFADNLAELEEAILRDGLTVNQLRLTANNNADLILVVGDIEFTLATGVSNRNVSGTVSIGDGWYLRFDIRGNGANVREWTIFYAR